MVTRFTVSLRLVFVVAALVIPISAMSQSFYGSLVAVVEDPSGVSRPGPQSCSSTRPRVNGARA